jgi:hypothetical protein
MHRFNEFPIEVDSRKIASAGEDGADFPFFAGRSIDPQSFGLSSRRQFSLTARRGSLKMNPWWNRRPAILTIGLKSCAAR